MSKTRKDVLTDDILKKGHAHPKLDPRKRVIECPDCWGKCYETRFIKVDDEGQEITSDEPCLTCEGTGLINE